MQYELWLYVGMTVMVIIGLAVLWPFLIKTHQIEITDDQLHEQALKRRLAESFDELKAKRDAGEMDEATYQQYLEDLQRQALEETGSLKSTPHSQFGGRLSKGWLAVIVVLVAGVPFGIYQMVGAPEIPRLTANQAIFQGTPTIASLESYVKSNSRDGRAWYMLAQKYQEDGQVDKALDAFRQARKITKLRKDPEVSQEFAALLLQQRSETLAQEAYQVITEARAQDPNNPQLIQLGVLSEDATARYQEAKVDMEHLLELMTDANGSPNDPRFMQYFDYYQQLVRKAEGQKRAQQKGL